MDHIVSDNIRAFKMGVNLISDEDAKLSENIIDNITAEPVDNLFEINNNK